MKEEADQLEIEMKFPVPDFEALKKKLRQLKARRKQQTALHMEDYYFNAPDRDFARTDEALRLRRIGMANKVTYKGPKRDAHTKTRTEIEIDLARGKRAAEDFQSLLRHLGYRDVAVVCKERQIYHLKRGSFAIEVCLDKVEGLGTYAELEIQEDTGKLDPARNVLLKLAEELGLSGSERRSYLELLLKKKAGR